jgi:hypothetical protein
LRSLFLVCFCALAKKQDRIRDNLQMMPDITGARPVIASSAPHHSGYLV